jgi:hypothetical protein
VVSTLCLGLNLCDSRSHANLFTPLYILIFLFIARYFLKAGSSDTWADNLIPWSLTDLILWSRNIDSFDLVFWLAVGLCLYAMWISGVTRSHSQASGACLWENPICAKVYPA